MARDGDGGIPTVSCHESILQTLRFSISINGYGFMFELVDYVSCPFFLKKAFFYRVMRYVEVSNGIQVYQEEFWRPDTQYPTVDTWFTLDVSGASYSTGNVSSTAKLSPWLLLLTIINCYLLLIHRLGFCNLLILVESALHILMIVPLLDLISIASRLRVMTPGETITLITPSTTASRVFHRIKRYKRRPSGCIIQDMPNGYSSVNWIEHVEAEDEPVHGIFTDYACEPFVTKYIRHWRF
ncbi:hypothetical protein L1887_32566 [Cichorium endivia]|nr:hypothetical protein L1887_32566 [Cichorium endivia]